MERKERPYASLRSVMRFMKVTYGDVVRAWNEKTGKKMNEPYMSEVMNGKRRLYLDFAYFLLDYLEIPHEQFSEYFPVNGGLTK